MCGTFRRGLDSDDFSPPALVCPKSPRRLVGEIGYCLRFEAKKILFSHFFVTINFAVFLKATIGSVTDLASLREHAYADIGLITLFEWLRPRDLLFCFSRRAPLKKPFNFRLPGTWPTTRRTSGSGNKKPNNDSLPRQKANDTITQF